MGKCVLYVKYVNKSAPSGALSQAFLTCLTHEPLAILPKGIAKGTLPPSRFEIYKANKEEPPAPFTPAFTGSVIAFLGGKTQWQKGT